VIVGFPPHLPGREREATLFFIMAFQRGGDAMDGQTVSERGGGRRLFSFISLLLHKPKTLDGRDETFSPFLHRFSGFLWGGFFFQWHSSIAEFFRLLFLIPCSSFLYLCLVSGKRGQEKYYFECQDFLIDMQNKKTRSKEQREKEKKDTGLSYFNSLRLTIRFLIIRGGKTQRVVTKR
jgi:hypothetical protein